jgi:acyl carrier protein
MESLGLIREFLQDRLGIAPDLVVSDAQLDALGVDSLMLLELMFEFEDRFSITLSKDLNSPKTVGEMVTLMDQLRSEQS